MVSSTGPKKHDFIVVGKEKCPYTQKSVDLLEKKDASFIYHELTDLSPKNFDNFDCEEIFAANLMMKGKAQFYNKVPMIFAKNKQTGKYTFLEKGSESLFEMFGEKKKLKK